MQRIHSMEGHLDDPSGERPDGLSREQVKGLLHAWGRPAEMGSVYSKHPSKAGATNVHPDAFCKRYRQNCSETHL